MLVVKLYEPKMVGTGQLADMTGKAMLKDDINSIIEGKSYQMFVRSFQQLSLARSGSSVDEIDDIENDTADIDEDDEENKDTITGFQDFQSLLNIHVSSANEQWMLMNRILQYVAYAKRPSALQILN